MFVAFAERDTKPYSERHQPKHCVRHWCRKIGKFCNIAGGPENIGSCMLQKSGAKTKGNRAGRSTGTALGPCCKTRAQKFRCILQLSLFRFNESTNPNPPSRAPQKSYFCRKDPETAFEEITMPLASPGCDASPDATSGQLHRLRRNPSPMSEWRVIRPRS